MEPCVARMRFETLPEAPSSPVFVVGAPRSGTTMLAAMLGSHPDLAAGPETQFFSKLPLATLQRAAEDNDWPYSAARLLSELILAEQSVLDLFETSQEQAEAFLASREPGIGAILEALTVPYAKARGADRWVEKTPNHILNLETLRALWPEAHILRIIRDPRDVGLSMRRLPTFSDEVLPNIYIWQRWNAQAEDFFASDPKAMTLRYEDLVDDPEFHLRRICDRIDLGFDPAMVAFASAAMDVSSANETWKNQVSSGLTTSRKYVWKTDLPDKWRIVCDLVCHELLIAHGYEAGPAPARTHTAFRMSQDYVEGQQEALRALAEHAVRWLPSEDPMAADRVVDHPEHYKFSNPIKLARLALGRARSWRERAATR